MSIVKRIINWFKEPDKPRATTHISVKRSGGAVVVGRGSYANSGVTIRNSSGSVVMTAGNITIRGQRGPVDINGCIYNDGDPLPEGVDITWAK